MNPIISINKLIFAALVLALGLVMPSGLQAQTFNVIHSFAGSDGSGPLAGLAIDSKGNLYGTTINGGQYGAGVVFRATAGGQEGILHNFGSVPNDGESPESSLIFDATGNLYGTTFAGGTSGVGTVFKLTRKGTETVLYSFAGGADGANPEAHLAVDKSGNLYGTTTAGGTSGGGTVFEISTGRPAQRAPQLWRWQRWNGSRCRRYSRRKRKHLWHHFNRRSVRVRHGL